MKTTLLFTAISNICFASLGGPFAAFSAAVAAISGIGFLVAVVASTLTSDDDVIDARNGE